ncbi:MAG: putative oxidoreductase protein, partial [Actinomycetia bacterium]|nr:putative oxidoreductase protein [Actinomycetes bacterium]
ASPGPTEAQVRSALDGNLCRCGSHQRIVRAVLRAASQNGPADGTPAEGTGAQGAAVESTAARSTAVPGPGPRQEEAR